MSTITLDIPLGVLKAAGAPIPPQYDGPDEDVLNVEFRVYNDGYGFKDIEGTVDGTWKDGWNAERLPAAWRTLIVSLDTKAREAAREDAPTTDAEIRAYNRSKL